MNYKDCWYLGVCPLVPDGCSDSCVRFAEMKFLVENSNIPKAQWFPKQLMAFKDQPKYVQLRDIKNNIVEWVGSGNSLYLYSANYGNGKTSWAIKLMLSYFNGVWAGNGFKVRGVFISVPEFIDRSREAINNRDHEFSDLKHYILNCDLVIWDDISSVKLTDFNHSILLNCIDARVLANKSNIFTGNADEKQLANSLGGRLSSRIWNGCTVIEFVNGDMRGKNND